jgi:predicted O-linked N-acetylglucosamine transferase (SPINDLY family)
MKTRLQAAAELLHTGRLAEARTKLLKELRLSPRSAPALELLGAVASQMGRHEEAIGYLRRAADIDLSAPGPRLNLGTALLLARHYDEAADVLRHAVSRWPNIPEGRLSYGNALLALKRREQAIQEYHAALRLNPRQAGTCTNLAIAFFSVEDFKGVRQACERLLALDPTSVTGQSLLAMSQQICCDWQAHEPWLARLRELAERDRTIVGMAFFSLIWSDDGLLHRRFAELETKLHAAPMKTPLAAKRTARNTGRIRVAYVSADFRRHPMTAVITGVFEHHDRDRFEVVGVSLGEDDKSPERQRIMAAFDRILHVHDAPIDDIVSAMREMELDIAVDLMGHTTHCRPGIFLQRVAPIQASYLGFPGPSGIGGIDYTIADQFVADGDLRTSAAERLAILPDCYWCTDSKQTIPSSPPTRVSCGLPADGFVFCSFNHAKKLTPQVFDQWMRILREIEGSVLWLIKSGADAERNLCREAERRGVAPERLIFADFVNHSQHLARNAVPDLHLDTFPYGAHTTASDALWAGSPILARAGRSFASRVCGSLLATIGVPELITANAEDYQALAIRLARDKPMLADLRRRIEDGRGNSPLFDTARFCRNLERAYEAMVERSREGQPPTEIDVRSLPGGH